MRTFKEVFCFDSITDMREEIVSESQKERWDCARGLRRSELLVTSKWGQLLVVDDDGRLEKFGFCDAIDIRGNIPTKREIKALYEEVIETGATNFKIVFDAMIRAWDDFPHKFSGECAEPTDWYLEVELVDSK